MAPRERSGTALFGLARVSGLGAARFFIYQGLKVDLQEFDFNVSVLK